MKLSVYLWAGRSDIMSKSYTVKSGDTLGAISVKYYGVFGKWTDIVKSNPQLAGRKTAIDGSPLIYPSDVLIIQDKPLIKNTNAPIQTKQEIVLDPDAKKDLALYVDGKKFTGFTGFTVSCPVDTFDAFSFSSLWDSSKKEIRDIFRPFTYKNCSVYFDGDLIFKGVLLPATPEVTPNSKTITVQGYPLCAVLQDSTLPDSLYPPQYDGLDLKQITDNIAGAFGVSVQAKVDVGSTFEKVEIKPEDKILDFLTKLANQRGLFFTNAQDGSLLIWKPEEEAVSATFKEGEPPFYSCKPAFDGQNMFSHITGFTKVTADKDSEKYTFENSYLKKAGVLRCYTKVIDDAESGTIENSTKAIAGRMFANSVKYTLEVTGHRDKNGKLYRKNMMVSVLAPDAEIYKETKFQVDEVKLERSDSDGEKTTFTLVLPGARTGKLPEAYPWEE